MQPQDVAELQLSAIVPRAIPPRDFETIALKLWTATYSPVLLYSLLFSILSILTPPLAIHLFQRNVPIVNSKVKEALDARLLKQNFILTLPFCFYNDSMQAN